MDNIIEISSTYNDIYRVVIEDLKQGKRPQIKLSNKQHDHLLENWQQSMDSSNNSEIFKILCVLDNTISLSGIYDEIISTTLLKYNDSEIKVLTLGVARRHVIDYAHQRGERVNYDFIMVLKELLSNNVPEVLEWTLRLIESLGNQSIILKEDVLNASPGLTAFFNSHKKASKQIIELLNKRWTR